MDTAWTEALQQQLKQLLAGQEHFPLAQPDARVIHAWQLLRWEPSDTLDEQGRTWLLLHGAEAFAGCGVAAALFAPEATNELFILLGHTAFNAKVHRDTSLWLCCHRLYERCGNQLEQEGSLFLSDASLTPFSASSPLPPMEEAVAWWRRNAPMDSATAHAHWLEIQTILKRRQFTALGGHITRALRNEAEPGPACFGFVPVVIEAVWSQYPNISIETLTAALNLHDMTRRPKEVLLAWISALSSTLRSQTASMNHAPIERVVTAIQADCSLPYSQANLSRSLGLTPAYFCRLFREKTGQHFSAFLTNTRMNRARELLRQGNIPLQTVSEQCGYPNKSYFCQVFKRTTGMTPGEYEQRVAMEKQQQ